ncbi:alpha/beta hydrolase [Methanocalculus sp.]|uniref:alpha/beta fold hydrolase n=1 Tax=Methanocalculus sp. TaxID=2004547 RepID=UPI00260A78A9|nr:alpha/beta hydrolase [Methanocalculus sp.]MDG6251562.1 alpha/beta hydrolase [Methanocalculus sp.]
MIHEVKSIELNTGIIIQYVEKGDPSGVPVLLLHGLSDSWHSFELVLPHLPGTIRAFSLSQRGHGDSQRPEKDYQVKDLANDVKAFLDALDISKAVILGHSLGSAVAQRFVIDYPERTLGMVVAGSFYNLAKSPVLKEISASFTSQLNDPKDPEFVREFQESTIARPVQESFFETIVQESLKVPARVWQALVDGALQDDFSEKLHTIKLPTMIIWGDRDVITTRNDQEAQIAAIQNAHYVEYSDTGHAPHWEEPRRFALDLVTFVETNVIRGR